MSDYMQSLADEEYEDPESMEFGRQRYGPPHKSLRHDDEPMWLDFGTEQPTEETEDDE